MAQVEVILPKMGESVAEATIIKWLKDEGENIEAEESLLEIATDKVDSEVPAPSDGKLVKKLFNEGDVAKVGQPIAIIETEGGEATGTNGSALPGTSGKTPVKEPAPAVDTVVAPEPTASQPVASSATAKIEKVSSSGRFYSPLVRSIAKKEGVSMQELEQVAGSGENGRVNKKDILAYLKTRQAQPYQQEAAAATSANGSQTQPAPQPAVSANEGDQVIEMDRMRKMIAEHMVMSKRVSPHVTCFVEADVTNIVNWRNKIKKKFEEREGEKLTFTPVFIDAIVKAIKDFPMVNVSVDGDRIIKRGNVNIGMAAALPSGNLIVPVIHNADQLNMIGLTKKVNDLANRARQNKLKPEEIQGGTFTITNVGTFGNVMGTPIINQPQVAILATGAIRKKPAVIETEAGDTIGIRHMMFLSLSFDHRVVDGSLGGSYVRRVGDYLEGFDPNTVI